MKYSVRVELHKDPEPDYDQLHVDMDEEGFARWIWSGSEGLQKLALPTAEYVLETPESSSQVLMRARRAAERAHPGKYGVMVTPMVGKHAHFGLSPWVDTDEG